VVTASLDPDELRLDDERWAAVWVAPIARVRWSPEEHYLAAACEVLESGGRLRKGDEVTLGSLGPGPSIVEPPQDAAQVGALNRALARRGVDWRFGILRLGSELTDSGDLLARERVTRRYALEATGSGQTGVVVRVGGSPWIVRSGETVLLGSRLDPDWTTLPFSSGFVPFVDAMVNRLARGQLAPLDAAPGDVVLLPDQVSQVRSSERTWPTEGGAAFRAPEPGLYFLLRDRDTVGVLAVNVDPRESRLERASDREVTRLWPRARLAGTRDAGSAAFTGVARADLRGPLLALALGLGLAEVFLASAWKRRS
jgi:hypothetical protein